MSAVCLRQPCRTHRRTRCPHMSAAHPPCHATQTGGTALKTDWKHTYRETPLPPVSPCAYAQHVRHTPRHVPPHGTSRRATAAPHSPHRGDYSPLNQKFTKGIYIIGSMPRSERRHIIRHSLAQDRPEHSADHTLPANRGCRRKRAAALNRLRL